MRRITPLALLVVAACSGGKGTAEAAIAAADSAIAALPPDAAKIAPEDVSPLTQAVQSAKDQLAKGDVEAATATAKAVPAEAQAVAAKLPARKAAMSATLDTLAVAMPRNLEAIQKKLDALGKSRKLPPGLDAQLMQATKELATGAPGEWNAIMASYKAGDVATAMTRAQDMKARVTRSLMALGLTADEKAWSNVTLPPKP